MMRLSVILLGGLACSSLSCLFFAGTYSPNRDTTIAVLPKDASGSSSCVVQHRQTAQEIYQACGRPRSTQTIDGMLCGIYGENAVEVCFQRDATGTYRVTRVRTQE